ncbi:MAG: aspartate-semialdehyde dehydrogenase, partial [Vulcanimicrobiaceae bacterium]
MTTHEGGSVRVAVVGATGAVGETLLRVLEERGVPVSELGAFASRFRPDAAAFRGRRCDVHET